MLTPVGVTTSDYIDALKADSPVHVKMTFPAQGVVLTDQDVDISSGLTMNDILNGDIDLTFGRAVMKQLTVGIINSNRVSGLIWTDEFDLELGVDIGVNTYYVKIGTFIGEKPNNINNVQIINFTAYDYMQKFDGLADDYWEGITFPATVESIYHGLCDYVGVGYVSGDELPYIMNRTFTTAPAQLQGYTCRDLLAWLAEACGCYAKINADGNCKMVWYTDHSSSLAFALDDEFHIETADLNTGLTWDEFDQYYWDDADKLQWNDVCSYEEAYAIDCIQVKQLGADVDVCYPMEPDGNVYMIVENPFLSVESADDIQYYIKPLFDRLSAHGGHLPMEVQCVGNYLVETGDIISVDVDGVNTLYSPVYTRTFKWKGSCTDTYETTGNVERQKVSSENRAKLVTRNNIRFVAKDLYYNIQSGIDIKPEGIEIDGSKYIKMKSGSDIEVESGADFNIKNGGKLNVKSGGDIDVESGAYVNIKSGGRLNVKSGGQININATGNLKLTGSTVEIKSGSTFDVESENLVIDSETGVLLARRESYVDPGEMMKTYIGGLQHDLSGFITIFEPSDSYITVEGEQKKIYSSMIWVRDFLSEPLYSNRTYIQMGLFYENIDGTTEGRPTVRIGGGRGNEGKHAVLDCGYINGRYIYSELYIKTPAIYATNVYYSYMYQQSSKDIKHNIKPLESVGYKIDKLEPVTFVYDSDQKEQTRMGLIYEDTVKVMPEICTNNEGNKAINYVELIPALLKEIQDLRSRVKTLEDKLNERGDT